MLGYSVHASQPPRAHPQRLRMKGLRPDFTLYGWLFIFALVNAFLINIHLKTLRAFDLPLRAEFNSTW